MVSSKIKNISITFILALFLLPNKSFSQLNSDVNFYPLHVGDKWVYNINFDSAFDNEDSTYYATTTVIGKEVIEGREYFIIDDAFGEREYVRIDSAEAIVWGLKHGREKILDSLSCKEGDSWGEDYRYECTDVSFKSFFQESRLSKSIRHNSVVTSGFSTRNYSYADRIGQVFFERIEIGVVGATRTANLVYAKIDGVEYGDTTLFEAHNIRLSESTLYLFQNENNPNFADTTWLINNSSEILMVDSVINNHGYSYLFDVLFSDSSTQIFALSQDYFNKITYSVNPNDSVRIILSNPDLCPICDGGEINVFTDSLHIFTTSKENPVLLLAIIGDGTLDAENIESGKLNFSLSQNYPNPFNPSTTIKYSIPLEEKLSRSAGLPQVTLKVYNILGQEVATLVNKQQKPGNYEVIFDGSSASGGQGLSSGIYFYKLQSGQFVESKKMLLLK